ncbi:symporter small accessory protein [Methanobacterium sp. ACI-7]|uniref:symporter small accessory protein n=1 Tax=unclassified Methanobacterium TaxID=2627676 RepID=UPI0039C39A48
MVLGIEDPWIWGAYILCILSMLLCVVYGALNWNKGGENEEEQIREEIEWHKKEKEMEEKELGLWDEEG